MDKPKKTKLILAVTPDRYELPIAVEETQNALAKDLSGRSRYSLGNTANVISRKLTGKAPNSLDEVKSGKASYFVRTVEVWL